ncbi:hypothetical protein [Alteribacillus bidgolensis]|uniref:Uncharacterized protein n=1 Tax=Alteribacillus bidgolensis TaxID=930129 RepID=A0A1G8ELU8_9BACI|nr:hypothetical protein [Alteribacillus bidgolensis]SDH70850.1 hypothetical protein SAMN05216352_102284 [Alteribacillus bidgolensis]
METKEIYYDKHEGGYYVVKEDIYRKEIMTLKKFYPSPPHLKFEEVEEMFIEQLNKELLPSLEREYLHQVLKD